MKTIVVPTDFSKTAENAMWYAAEIAKKARTKLILFHVYQFPYVSPEIPGTITSFEEIETSSKSMLQKLHARIVKKYGKTIQVEYFFKFGTIGEEIRKFTVAKKAWLVVIGMQGAGYLAERLLGSTATSMISKLRCPVLTIGKDTKFKIPKTIALAYNYSPVNKRHLDKIKAFAQLFKAQVCVVHVASDTGSLPNRRHATLAAKMEKILGEKNITFYYVENTDISEGLKSFTTGRRADMVAMLPESHGFLSRLFREPYSKKIAFHTRVPLLTIHQ